MRDTTGAGGRLGVASRAPQARKQAERAKAAGDSGQVSEQSPREGLSSWDGVVEVVEMARANDKACREEEWAVGGRAACDRGRRT